MACEKKERNGYCGHFQCPFSDETEHGYECVEIYGDCCEVGHDCYEGCEYSYTDEDLERIEESKRIVEQRYGD